MKILLREKIVATLGLLVLLTLCISIWLFRTQEGKSLISKPLFGLTNGLKNPGQDFYIRQHGQYWVLYNYIRATKEFSGNESVTLVLHGYWTDMVNLAETSKRWHGPISLTLFICGEDLDRAISALVYLMYCSKQGPDLKAFLSVNLIMHKEFIPKYIRRTELERYYSNADCFKEINFSKNERVHHNLTFPSNLARNVGRITAGTHFVLLLDVEFIPSARIPELFLKMIKANENNVYQTKTTVYVLPSFDIKFGHIVPERVTEFKLVDQNFLQLYMDSMALHKIPRLREWFEANGKSVKSVTGIFDRTRRWGQWLAYYISVNNIEPFYDDNYDGESEIDSHLDLLEALDYNFYVLNLGFVVRCLLPPYNFYTEMPLKNNTEARVKKLKKITILRDFYLNFL